MDRGYRLEIEYDSQNLIHSVQLMTGGRGSEFNQYLMDKVEKQSDMKKEDFEEFYAMEKVAFKKEFLK